MGCSSSQQAESTGGSSSHNTFKVTLLDNRGQDSCTGLLEVTLQELILYQKGKDFMRWPLWSLRRYGFDRNLFSFESGRRCPTGPGFFAFRCQQAEALFSLLQVSLLWAGGQSQENNRMSSVSTMEPVIQAAVFNHVQSTLEINGSGTSDAVHNYVNDPATFRYYNISQQWVNGASTAVQYADIFLPAETNLFQESTADKSSTAKARAYVNVPAAEKRPDYVNLAASNGKNNRQYINIPTEHKKTATDCPVDIIEQDRQFSSLDWRKLNSKRRAFENSGYTCTPADPAGKHESECQCVGANKGYLNVAVNRRSVPLPLTRNICLSDEALSHPEGKHGGYAVIDFDKTLAISAKGKSGGDDSLRKTRHSCDVEAVYYC